MKPYKLDRSAFKMQTAAEAANNYNYWKTKSPEERLKAAFYLNSIAYNFDIDNPPRMDKSLFQVRIRN
jgi:hypothetical protein